MKSIRNIEKVQEMLVPVIAALKMQSRGAKIVVNHTCLACGDAEKEMVAIGSLYFCPYCFHNEFETRDPVRQERDRYIKWLESSNNKANGAGEAH